MDSVPCLTAWAESLGGITYPLLSDFYPHGKVAQAYGVLRPEGYSERAIFVIDKAGIIRYVDVHAIDEQPDNEVLFRVLAEIEPDLAARWQKIQASREVTPLSESELQVDVVMYCTPWCPDCRRARTYFQANGIHYTEIDITRDRAAAQVLRGWTGGKEITPTFNVRGNIVVSYELDRLAQLLGIQS